jgi:GTP pyrophosphokinase
VIFDDVALEQQLFAHMGDDPALSKAIGLARQVHAGALRDEGTPYVSHPMRVALILLDELGVSDRVLVCAAVLHDVIEDSPTVTYDQLLSQFGPSVAGTVRCLTDEFKRSGLPRAERRALYLARIARAEADCLIVKVCDRIDNLRSLAYTTDVEKRSRMMRETETILLPALANRPHPFPDLERLTRSVLQELDPTAASPGDPGP